ncbi:hypothetical protein [Methylobacterium sp. ARG-1]|uniref:hypothetical protein n=1 Tax=Methylobacterium sp. ARG-1 TaxID=1692501 RepID=UPI000680FECB|nr:hypothetical protein [Methylobacterium sp. ARG-1]KNY21137.1 hypothetical protein AKJ13_18355 [Methylobacterium sp. ARG-1]
MDRLDDEETAALRRDWIEGDGLVLRDDDPPQDHGAINARILGLLDKQDRSGGTSASCRRSITA